MRIDGNDYVANDLQALAADLRQITASGFKILPLRSVVDAWLDNRGHELDGKLVALTCSGGGDFDYVDLPHPTAGTQRSVFNILRDFAAENPGKQEQLNVTSFVVASPEARAALDATCMIGKGWWTDAWWSEAAASGLMHIANHSWDHNHETLPASFSKGVANGTFLTIDTRSLADYEIKRAAEYLRAQAPNPGTALFAYPYGDANLYLTRQYFPSFGAALGIEAAFTTRAAFLEPGTGRWEVPRFVFGRDWTSPAELQSILDAAGDRKRAWAPVRRKAHMMAPPKDGARGAASQGAARQKSARVEVGFSPPTRVGSGLVPVYFEINGPDPAYELSLESDSAALRYRKTVDAAAGPTTVATFINSHLLPNGKSEIRASLARTRGETVWRASFDLHVSNTGTLAAKVRTNLQQHGTPAVLDGFVDSNAYDMANPALAPWFDRPDALAHLSELRMAGRIDDAERSTLRQFVEEGYAILPVPLDDELLRTVNAELSDAIESKVEGYAYGSSQRIHNLHQRYPGVRSLWRHPVVMRYLELIFEVPARPCQTLTYIFGSQQGAHQDTIHLTPFPAGYMCGVWIALEDVQPNSGELEIFRGSHRLPRVYMHGSGCAKVTDDDWSEFGETVAARWREMLAAGRFEKMTYRPRRGTILIWHENLMHGGSVRIDESLSRRSIVSHYFADGAIAFYDSTGVPGNME